MEENDYKAAHESFVSGHGGTTPQEIMLVSLVVPVSILLLAFVRRVGYTSNLTQVLALAMVYVNIRNAVGPQFKPWLRQFCHK